MLIEWLYELKDQIDKHGIRVGLILTLFVMYRKELRNKRLDMRDEAMFKNQKIIMDTLGVGSQWNGQAKISHKDLMNYKQLQQSYSAGISQVGFLFRRRGSKMKISKTWLSGVIAYLLGQLAIKYGFTFNDAMADTAADFVITLVIPLFIAFVNKTRKEKFNEPTIELGSNK